MERFEDPGWLVRLFFWLDRHPAIFWTAFVAICFALAVFGPEHWRAQRGDGWP